MGCKGLDLLLAPTRPMAFLAGSDTSDGLQDVAFRKRGHVLASQISNLARQSPLGLATIELTFLKGCG